MQLFKQTFLLSILITMKHWFVLKQSSRLILLSIGLSLFCLGRAVSFATEVEWDLHDNAWEHNRKGEWLLNRQDYTGALEEFKAGLMLSQGSGREATFYNNIGMTYMNLGQSMAAVDSFQMASRLAPSYALYYLNLIRAYIQGQQQTELERSLHRTLIINEADAEAWFLLGILYRSESKPEKAIDAFQRQIKLQPSSELSKASKLLIKEQEPPKKPL